jgi:choice-of-anchor A domain-containing protein
VINGITIKGETEAFAKIDLTYKSIHFETVADGLGAFEFTAVDLLEGENKLNFVATDRANNLSDPKALTLYFNDVNTCSVFGLKSMTPYNAFVFEDFNGYSSEVSGSLFAGQNIIIENYAVGRQLPQQNGTNVLVSAADINFRNGRVYNGNIIAAGSILLDQTVVNSLPENSQVIENAQIPVVTDLSRQEARLFTQALIEMTESSAFSINAHNLKLQGSCDDTVQNYSITFAELKNINTLSVNCQSEDSYIILNVSGNEIVLNNLDTSALVLPHKVIWNFFEAKTIEINNAQLMGSLLAVYAEVSDAQYNDPDVVFVDGFESYKGVVNGQLVVKSFNSRLKLTSIPFSCSNAFSIDATPIAEDKVIKTYQNSEVSFSLGVLDENPSSLRYEMISNVTIGVLQGSMPHLTYKSDIDYIGATEFEYKVTDQFGKSTQAVIRIEIDEDVIFKDGFEDIVNHFNAVEIINKFSVISIIVALTNVGLWRRK